MRHNRGGHRVHGLKRTGKRHRNPVAPARMFDGNLKAEFHRGDGGYPEIGAVILADRDNHMTPRLSIAQHRGKPHAMLIIDIDHRAAAI